MMNGSQSSAAALEPTMRRRVLQVVTRAPAPLDAQTVAELVGLHITTARFHLDQLESTGLVGRQVSTERRRGRPRVLYVAVGTPRDEAAREQLIDVLATALATRNDVARVAADAGRGWADASALTGGDSPSASLVEALDRLGFDPVLDGESIALHACPFRDQARAHPEVVCSVHRGLIDRVLARADGGTTARLLPFVQPDLCVVRLSG